MMNHVNMVALDLEENAAFSRMAMLAPITFWRKMQKEKIFDVIVDSGCSLTMSPCREDFVGAPS